MSMPDISKHPGYAGVFFYCVLDQYHVGDHHWMLRCLLQEEASNRVCKLTTHEIDINRIHILSGVLDGLLNEKTCFLEQPLRFTNIYEATRNDVW